MPSVTPKLANLVAAVYADMLGWSEKFGGKTALTQNPQDLIKLIINPPTNGWRVLIHWRGFKNAGQTAQPARGGVMDYTFAFILDGVLPLHAAAGLGLVLPGSTNQPPFLQIVETVHQRVMAYRFPWLGTRNDKFMFIECDDNIPLSTGEHLAAYVLKYQLFAPAAQPDVEQNAVINLNPA